MSGDPYSKGGQLKRGERRYRRKVASPKQWQAIIAAKIGPCRICCNPASNGSAFGKIQMHHVVSRARGGDDCVDNIVPLCPTCHEKVSQNDREHLAVLAASLTDAETAYVIGKLGAAGMERTFGAKA